MKTNVKDGIIHVERHSLNKRVRLVWILASLFMIIGGALGLVFIQTPISEPQLIEKQASVDNGLVKISAQRDSSLLANKEAIIYLNIDTNQVQINELELTFSVVSDAINELEVQVLPVGFKTNRLEIDATSTGFLVNIATETPTDTSFSTSGSKKIVKLIFTPTTDGIVTLNFDADKSTAIVANFDPAQDELKHIASADFYVEINPDSPEIKSCNDLCENNADCPVNFSCFQTSDGKRCRRATNTDSVTCAYPDEENTETNVILTNQGLCNQSCSSESDCAINLTCYYGECRLASNPSSTSCSSVKKRIVYKTIYKTVSPDLDKGGDLSKQASDSAQPATISATISDEKDNEEVEIPYQPNLEEKPVVNEIPEETTALESLLNNLKDRGFSLSLIMILAGAMLIAIVLISSLLGRRKNSNHKTMAIKPAPLTPETQEQMSSLEDRIKSLQQSPPSARVDVPAPTPAPAPTPTQTPINPNPTPLPMSMAQRAKFKGIIKPERGKTEIFSNKS